VLLAAQAEDSLLIPAAYSKLNEPLDSEKDNQK
jgi:hypothetical protein